ncbi:hypothetical protein LQK65_004145 [Vibrio parahaemolyticus]|uniref:hypothetical protein n=1 Tax=Vibrio parahaemolyticus TaxID=670 RepID=UPI00235F1337|nr:hypothetical protein [Vibrio parahaemolyticus]EHI9243118.1 hypothetical protein [Vibrio vulnificus]EIJ0985433.1 hypothetical protein [Vibrio vulnificus]EIO4083672.1 hypothetical protein [Vibrio parahaemolyticus]EJC1449787.1 hypothetical protein [Vibrio parahaemolyticus]EJV9424511.1 hypothetical protein [Vibrio vulnificus]
MIVGNKLHLEFEFKLSDEEREELLESTVKEIVEINVGSFYERMARISIQYDMRAEVLTDTFEVTEVTINFTKNVGVASVEYDWDAYYGCKDMCGGDRIEDEWSFEVRRNTIVFDLNLPQDNRFDEI